MASEYHLQAATKKNSLWVYVVARTAEPAARQRGPPPRRFKNSAVVEEAP